jgi:predicted peptidase
VTRHHWIRTTTQIAAALLLFALVRPAFSREVGMTAEAMKAYTAREYKDDKGGSLPYRLLVPKGSEEKGERKYPLVLFLHGAGERGSDNTSQLKWGGAMLATDLQEKEPCFVIAPQCPNGKQWVNTPWGKGSYSAEKVPVSDELRMALAAVDEVKKEFPIDSGRVYVMGLSMGGYGTWDAIARRPGEFAAAVPICGGGDPSKAGEIKHVTVWAFHGGADPVVPTQGTRDMIEALKKAGAEPKYTEYPGVGHDSWTKAWNEPELLTWLLGQKRGK